jgi:RsiW-degrading membrane proteinase PrsW (M82 family)
MISVPVEAVLAAFLPAVIWLWIVYSRDRYEHEPKRLIEKLFLASVVAAGIAMFLERGLQVNLNSSKVGVVVASAIAVGIVEEGAKFNVARALTRRNPAFNEPVDGIIYTSSVALGFAAIETTLYILRFYYGALHVIVAHGYTSLVAQQVASQVAFRRIAAERAILGCLGHLSFTGIIGYAYGLQKFGAKKPTVRGAFIAAALLHAAFDGFLSLGASTLAFAILAGSIAAYVQGFRRALAVSPFRAHQLRPAVPPPTGAHPASPWAPTAVVPAGGLRAWSRPDQTSNVMGTLAEGTRVRTEDHLGAWAHVFTQQGWSGWVDGRRLEPLPSSQSHVG